MVILNQSNIYIGTSGWSYPRGEGTWNGYFYPDAKISELEYYSQFFRTVEINSSFYHPPSSNQVNKWINQVPDDFLFSVKLWQKFTHPKMFKEATGQNAVASASDAILFLNSIEPLIKIGKFGALLAQFPAGFKNDMNGMKILSNIIKLFGHLQLAVELRHRSWSDNADVIDLFGEHNVTLVHIDEPKFNTSIASDLPLTGNIAYFRFHGRNAETWWSGDSETRYRYLYSSDEIKDLSKSLLKGRRKLKMTFAYFNNHWQGYAPRNAIDLLKELQLPFKDILLKTDMIKKE